MSDIQSLNEMRNILGMNGHHSHASENKENEAMNNQDEKSTIESNNAKGNNNQTRNKNGAERSLEVATGSKIQEMFETINETSFVIKVPNFDTKPIRRSPSTTASIVTISSSDDESMDELDASNAALGNRVDIII